MNEFIEILNSFFNLHPEAILCAPVLAIAGAVKTGIDAISGIAQGDSERAAGEYNAQIALDNARLTRQQAAEDERVFRVSSRKDIGAMRSGYAASGVTSEGSVMDVLEEGAATAELDALKLRHQGESKAKAFEQEAVIARQRGQAAQTRGYLSAAGSLLEGGVKTYDRLKRT